MHAYVLVANDIRVGYHGIYQLDPVIFINCGNSAHMGVTETYENISDNTLLRLTPSPAPFWKLHTM